MKKICPPLWLIAITILSLFIIGCEDDAILSPQNESDCTGSYCSLNIPSLNKKFINSNPNIF
mgnify:CR=1 FL=1